MSGTARATAVIIGYGPGLGRALAELYAGEGFDLGLISRSGTVAAEDLAAFQARGAAVSAAAADAGREGNLAAALGAVGATEAGILVYNAARWRSGPVLSVTPEALVDDLRVDVAGALAAVRLVAPAMAARGGGAILLTGGGYALHPSPAAPTLSIGKGAIRSLALMLAEELAPRGIRVCTLTIAGAIAPGGPFDPGRIAARFAALGRAAPDPATAEAIFTGEP